MAGSYSHIAGRGGDWSLIENMGDAHEAVEELLWLVRRTMAHDDAVRLLRQEFYPMKRGERPKDDALLFVERKMSGRA